MRLGAESNVVEVPVSWALDDYPHFEFVRMADAVMPGLKPPRELFDRWTDELHYMLRDFENGVVTFTFHPQVIGRGHRMLGLEAWLDKLAALDVRYCRVAEVAAEFSSGVDFGVYRPASGRGRDGAHAEDEHVVLSNMSEWASLISGLLARL